LPGHMLIHGFGGIDILVGVGTMYTSTRMFRVSEYRIAT